MQTFPRLFVCFSVLLVTLLVSTEAWAAPSVTMQTPAKTGINTAIASYIFVCRDVRGNLDRRACHHMGRLDPQRVTVAMR